MEKSWRGERRGAGESTTQPKVGEKARVVTLSLTHTCLQFLTGKERKRERKKKRDLCRREEGEREEEIKVGSLPTLSHSFTINNSYSNHHFISLNYGS